MLSQAVTAKGQVTLRRDILRHLGIKPGDRVTFDTSSEGKLVVEPAKPKGSINAFIGCLSGETDVVLTIDEMNDVIAAAWAGER
jgi:antitoxin PrlF